MLAALLPKAAVLGAKVLRVMLSGMLEGARASFPGGWEAHLARQIAVLKANRSLAEHHDIVIAAENHQDLDSHDLIRMCDEVGGRHIGVTLDAVNPLAVAEEPIAFARALGARIVNVHLKDYTIHITSEGYRLVRCALGQGVLDVPALFAVLAEVAPQATCNIELAAINARHIRVWTPEWWEGYPRTYSPATLQPLLAFLAKHVSGAAVDWHTPWEQGADAVTLGAYEEGQCAQSVVYLRSLMSHRTGGR